VVAVVIVRTVQYEECVSLFLCCVALSVWGTTQQRQGTRVRGWFCLVAGVLSLWHRTKSKKRATCSGVACLFVGVCAIAGQIPVPLYSTQAGRRIRNFCKFVRRRVESAMGKQARIASAAILFFVLLVPRGRPACTIYTIWKF